MNNIQMVILVAVPFLGIATNVGLFLYVAGRVDNLTDKVVTLTDRMTRVESEIVATKTELKADLKIHILEHHK